MGNSCCVQMKSSLKRPEQPSNSFSNSMICLPIDISPEKQEDDHLKKFPFQGTDPPSKQNQLTPFQNFKETELEDLEFLIIQKDLDSYISKLKEIKTQQPPYISPPQQIMKQSEIGEQLLPKGPLQNKVNPKTKKLTIAIKKSTSHESIDLSQKGKKEEDNDLKSSKSVKSILKKKKKQTNGIQSKKELNNSSETDNKKVKFDPKTFRQKNKGLFF